MKKIIHSPTSNLKKDREHFLKTQIIKTPKSLLKTFSERKVGQLIGSETMKKLSKEKTITPFPGDEYTGEMDKNNIITGYGIYKYKNGDIYEGEFKLGLREGIGEYEYQSGGTYRGQWKEDKKHGKGIYFYESIVASGEWEQDIFIKAGVVEFHLDEDEEFELNEKFNISSSEEN